MIVSSYLNLQMTSIVGVCIILLGSTCSNVNVAVSTGLGRFGPFPTASYPITLFSHETGHQLGSPHTHSCSWPGGPIDNCALPEDGLCQPGPTPIGGGSIMSYCSSIDFNKGIGASPRGAYSQHY
jgi:hypothetical protein